MNGARPVLPLPRRGESGAGAAVPGADRPSYTERLAGTDLSRVLYVYGVEDMIVGRLTEDEVGFLTSSGSRVLAVQGGHASMFEDPEIARQITAALAE